MTPAIERRVGEIYGDSAGGVLRCPGENLCDIWDASAGDYEQKALVCRDCKECNGNPPLRADATDFFINQEAERRIVNQIEKIRLEQKTFPNFDFSDLEYVEIELLKVWVENEEFYEARHKHEISSMFKILIQSRNG